MINLEKTKRENCRSPTLPPKSGAEWVRTMTMVLLILCLVIAIDLIGVFTKIEPVLQSQYCDHKISQTVPFY